MLHRIRDGYVTLFDLFRTVLSSGTVERMLIETGRAFTPVSFLGLSRPDYLEYESVLRPYGFVWCDWVNQYLVHWTEHLESTILRKTNVAASIYRRRMGDPAQRLRWESLQYWYWEHWKFFRSEVKTSIIQGIAVFLSLFETDPDVRRVFCPPKSLYEGKISAEDPNGRVVPPFDQLIESGKVVGLNFLVALNPALAKTIGTMMKVDYQRAVQLRIPMMDAEPDSHFRPTVFI